MKRLRIISCLVTMHIVFSATVATAGDPNPGAYDTVVSDFQTRGAFGAIVKVGYLSQSTGVRVGAAAKIGVTPDSFNAYRFALYVESRDESGNIVAQNASVMKQTLASGDPDRTGVYVNHAHPKPGTYVITSLLTAIDKDGSVTVLDQGKSMTYTVK